MDMMKEKVSSANEKESRFAQLQEKLKEMAELRKQYKVNLDQTVILQGTESLLCSQRNFD